MINISFRNNWGVKFVREIRGTCKEVEFFCEPRRSRGTMRGLSLQRRRKRNSHCKVVQRRWRISTVFAVLVEERGDCGGNIAEPWDRARCHHLIPERRRDVRLPPQRRVYRWSLPPGDFCIFHRLIWVSGALVLGYRFRSLPACLLLAGKYTEYISINMYDCSWSVLNERRLCTFIQIYFTIIL